MYLTLLKTTLEIVDKVLNPRAITLPVYYIEKNNGHFYYQKPERCFVIRKFVEDDKIHIWVVRWL